MFRAIFMGIFLLLVGSLSAVGAATVAVVVGLYTEYIQPKDLLDYAEWAMEYGNWLLGGLGLTAGGWTLRTAIPYAWWKFVDFLVASLEKRTAG